MGEPAGLGSDDGCFADEKSAGRRCTLGVVLAHGRYVRDMVLLAGFEASQRREDDAVLKVELADGDGLKKLRRRGGHSEVGWIRRATFPPAGVLYNAVRK